MGRSPVVLVVEKDESVYDLLSDFLATHGFSVFGAGRENEALALVDKLQPSLVILDHEQPSLDGVGLTRRLRSIDPAHHLPILLLTAHVEQRLEHEAFDAGCDGFVRKPFRLDDLAGELQRLCKMAEWPTWI